MDKFHSRLAAVDFSEPRWVEFLGQNGFEQFQIWIRKELQDLTKGYRLIAEVDHVLGTAEVDQICVQSLKGEIGTGTGKALEVLQTRTEDYTEAVTVFLTRLDAEQHHPHSAVKAAQYVLSRGTAQQVAIEVIKAFAQVEVIKGYTGNPMLSDLAFLMLEFAPERALPIVRRALRSSTPIVVSGMAALLAVLDQRWCHRELEDALSHKNEVHNQRYLVAALEHSKSEVAQQRATHIKPPHTHDGGAGFTFDEVVAANIDPWFENEMKEAGSIAERLDLPEDFS